ncbi:uncharacterized protein LOC132175631 [Corylus avellana]|uniref:uncharacterized protein LOC132175631 n=1 Tax=Corylus avellana TaxID=13451 RepID=UPI001E23418D|nr:uncharacterized protein LOC132175631 [Corylus avellana]
MDGRGGCCIGISRYGGGVYDMSKVDRIMLRFRPIAPKPVTGGSPSGGPTPEKADACVKSGRGKRRYARDYSNNNNNIVNSKRCNRKRKASPEEKVVTLPLLPEAPDRRESPERVSPGEKLDKKVEMREELNGLSFDGNNKVGQGLGFGGLSDRMAAMPPGVWVVGSCVIVECVMDTWVDGDGLGRTDEERRTTLRRDTCPGFVSDGLGRVTWTNEAYRRMVDQGVDPAGNQGHLTVWLVLKEETAVPSLTHSAFTCRVRVVQYDTRGKERSSLTLPCDVWRMDGGGFAWRLDVKAALCLGR